MGHEVRLIPPTNAKPCVKRQTSDTEDGVATCEETQGAAMIFRVREVLISQRTHIINALGGEPGEAHRHR